MSNNFLPVFVIIATHNFPSTAALVCAFTDDKAIIEIKV
uniref:Uncharacterized protein n=1 Tax=Moniliophthora roreri TaxID=221103 RepID=A0A0W0FZI3_MONRR